MRPILLAAILLIPAIADCQDLTTRSIRFTVETGFPSNTVYYVHQDRSGYMWFATDKGVCRYDGFEFETFTRKDGLSDNEAFSIFEDSQGRIWFATYNGLPCYFHNGQFFNPTNAPFLRNILLDGMIQQIHEDSNGNVYFIGYSAGFVKLSPDNETTVYDNFHLATNGIYSKNDSIYLSFGKSDRLALLDSTSQPTISDTVSSIGHGGIKVIDLNEIGLVGLLFIYTPQTYLWDLNSRNRQPQHPWTLPTGTRLINFYKHPKLGAYLIAKDTIYRYSWENLKNHGPPDEKIYTNGYSTSYMLIDKDSNRWTTSLDGGVFFHSKPFSSQPTLSFPNQQIRSYLNTGALGKIFVLSSGEIWRWNSGTVDMLSFVPELAKTTQISLMPSLNDSSIWVLTNKRAFSVNSNGIYKPHWWGSMTHIRETRNGFLLSTHTRARIISRPDSLTPNQFRQSILSTPKEELLPLIKSPQTMYSRIKTSISWNHDTVIIGYRKGIAWGSYSSNTIRTISPDQFNYSVKVLKKKSHPHFGQWLWVGGGDVLMGVNDLKDTLFADSNLISGETIQDILPWGDTLLFTITENRILSFKVDYLSKSLHFMGGVHSLQGIATGKILKLDSVNGNLWVISEGAVNNLEVSSLLNQTTPAPSSPLIKEIRLDNTSIPISNTITLAPDIQSVSLTIAALEFTSIDQVVFQYRLNNNSNWINTSTNDLLFSGLSAGNYKLEIRTLGANGKASSSIDIDLHVKQHWWENSWYWLLATGLFIFLVSLWIRWLHNNQKRNADMNLRLSQMELKALKAQMNPHFMFNALSSIQRYVLANETKLANEYLTKYSRLTRMVLNHSDKTLVPLEDEIQSLHYYIELEKLRLSHRFSYEIEVAPDLDPRQTMVPPLFLQAFVENSIWHGLSPKEDAGVLTLKFKPNDGQLLITILDNGIGRAAAQIINPRTGISKGSQIIQEKLAMLNHTTFEQKAWMKINDLMDGEGHALGTEVVISFPLDA